MYGIMYNYFLLWIILIKIKRYVIEFDVCNLAMIMCEASQSKLSNWVQSISLASQIKEFEHFKSAIISKNAAQT